MDHIRYLSDNLTICQRPQRLGYDFVVVNTYFGVSCRVCSDLLFAHNLEAYEQEKRDVVFEPKSAIFEDDVSAIGAFGLGLAISSILWVAVWLILTVIV